MTLVVGYADLSAMGVRYSRMHLRRLERLGLFPKHVQLSANRIAWLRSEVEAWLAGKAAERIGAIAA